MGMNSGAVEPERQEQQLETLRAERSASLVADEKASPVPQCCKQVEQDLEAVPLEVEHLEEVVRWGLAAGSS